MAECAREVLELARDRRGDEPGNPDFSGYAELALVAGRVRAASRV